MTDSFLFLAASDRRSRTPWAVLLVAIFLLVFAMHAGAQAPAAPPSSAEQVDKLVGPIALYPDDLVAIILPAATNPLQIVQADRYLEKRKTDPKLPIDSKWDDPVKSLLNYPDVVKKMSADLDWTSALGEAVVADQGAVLEGVQRFRRQAQAAGNLKSDGKQVVKTEKEIIIIEPADPQVIYVPQYNPTTVVVQSTVPVYGYYPAPYPSYYYPYPPGAAMAAGVIWGAAIGAAWSGNHYGCCGDTTINIDRNTNINTGNINTGNVNRGGGAGAQGGTAWKSNKQPGQVSGSVGKTASTARAGSTQSFGGTGAGTGAAARPSTQTAGGGNAFGDYGSGRQTQMDSSRGAASTSSMAGGGTRSAPSSSSMAGASTRSAPSGGGARGGGGGRGGGRR